MKTLQQILKAMPKARRAKIRARTNELIAEENARRKARARKRGKTKRSRA